MVLRRRHLPEPKLRTRDYLDWNRQLQVSNLLFSSFIVLTIQTLRTCRSIQKIPRQIRFHHRYLQRPTTLGQRARLEAQGSRSLVSRIQQLPRCHGSSRPRRNHAKRVRQETHRGRGYPKESLQGEVVIIILHIEVGTKGFVYRLIS
jgi:hypothetical protein